MAERLQFTRNFQDHSTDRGFQFEFFCDRCGNGFATQFKPSVTNTINDVIGTASSLLGGLFSSASTISDQVHSAAWQKAHDEAYQQAVKEIMPDFIQCPRCSTWVCKRSCWNTKRGLCKNCAPDLGVEMSAAQSNRSVEEIWAHAAMAEEDKKLAEGNWRETIVASCPNCGKPMATNAKFCPECGTQIKTKQFCTECGATLTPGAKFCPECGKKTT